MSSSPTSPREVRVSAFDPDTTTEFEPQTAPPDFPIERRGYDRKHVDAYLSEMATRLEQERQRAEDAERALYALRIEIKSARTQAQQPPSFVHLGAEAAKILEQAGRSAEALLAEAQNKGQDVIEEAKGKAVKIIKAAEQRAGEIEATAHRALEDAKGEAGSIVKDSESKASEIRSAARKT